MTFGLVETLALCSGLLFLGQFLQRTVPGLARVNIPAPVIGGLLAALVIVIARVNGSPAPAFDTTLQQPLLVAFFTTIGFSASLALLRAGGMQVVVLLVLVTGFAIVQNLLGIALALGFGLPPALGVLTGSVTLTGGPATGLAFAPMFESAGIQSAGTIAVATAMGGIVLGGLVGGPIGSFLIARHKLRGQIIGTTARPGVDRHDADAPPRADDAALDEDSLRLRTALKTVAVVLIAMWVGQGISSFITSLGVTLPAYIGAMLAAAVVRNLDDRTHWLQLPHSALDLLGAVALSFFLVMALMTLDLTRLASMAGPLIAMLLVQVAIVALFSLWPVFALMGRDYEAAVMTGGFLGFMLGTTANAMAVMRTLVERFGAAPRAFLVAPLVGAFFLDFTNALIITAFLNILQ